ncbi:MAG TPA: HD domain-containing protein [Candidatus Paceibacterota bacterium]
MKQHIPAQVNKVVEALEKQGFEAFVVGGCVRDLLLGKEPEDWDVATNAKPEEVQKIFPKHFYENKFFTVTVLAESENARLKEIEVTTYRSDHKYADYRRPGEVRYAKMLEEDLSRRDFTVNAVALNTQEEYIDPFEGRKDLKAKILRAVGVAEKRFQEDALRMMRAARLATVLKFTIEEQTKQAIQENAALLQEISKERIQDELVKIIMADNAMQGIELLRELKLLEYIMPELEEGYGIEQNKHHKYTVWEHNLLSLDYAAKQNWSSSVRVASLLHDVAKPRVKRGQGKDATFYDHEVVGASMAKRILQRLKFPNKDIESVTNLIRYHMFYYNVDEVTESAVRRLVRKIGPENVQDLLKLRQADRIGSGVPKAEPYKFRHLKYVIEKVAQDPISSSMLKINGNDIMHMGKLQPGPRVGHILDVLLGEILEEPKNNTKAHLGKRAKELLELPEQELHKQAVKSRQEREHIETRRDEMTKQKYWVG